MANLNYYKNQIKQLTLTQLLIGINILLFAVTQLVNISLGNGLIRMGAKVNALIGLGEFWRLFMPLFLHADIFHLIFNMLALYIFGRDIERFFGKGKFLAIYFSAGLLGSAASFLFSPNVSVGASGAIFGLMGANIYLYRLNPMVYKRLYGKDMLVLIAINLIIGFARPNIDIAGHLGGIIAGFLMANGVGVASESARSLKRLAFQGLTLLLIIGGVAVGTLRTQADPHLFAAGAYYYYTEGRSEKALSVIEKGLEKHPEDETLRVLLEKLRQ